MTVAAGFEGVLRRFLDELDALDGEASERGEGITGAPVQERLARAVANALVFGKPGMSEEFGLSDPHTNERLRQIVDRFFKAAQEAPDFRAASTEEARARLVAHDSVESHEGNSYWVYLGQWDPARLEQLRAPPPVVAQAPVEKAPVEKAPRPVEKPKRSAKPASKAAPKKKASTPKRAAKAKPAPKAKKAAGTKRRK
jgi:hypothetical protein